MEQKLSDTLVKAIDRSNPFMQNLQLASRFNKLVEQGGGGGGSGESGISYVLSISTDTDEYVDYRLYNFNDYINSHNPTQISNPTTVLKGTYKIVGAKDTTNDNNDYKDLLNAIISSSDTSGIIFDETANTITFEENWGITSQTGASIYNYGFELFLQ